MEELFKQILTDHGIVAGLFIITLFGLYKLAKWFGTNYLKLQEEHNKHFLQSFDNMIEKISTGDIMHSEEHEVLLTTLSGCQKNNNQQHEKMISMIKENTDNILLTHKSVEKLNKEIKLHHSN